MGILCKLILGPIYRKEKSFAWWVGGGGGGGGGVCGGANQSRVNLYIFLRGPRDFVASFT